MTVDVTSVWVGTVQRTGGGSEIRLELNQRGAKVSGTLRKLGAGTAGWGTIASGPIEGSVANDVFSFRRGDLTGEMTVVGDEMTGHDGDLHDGVPTHRFVPSLEFPVTPSD